MMEESETIEIAMFKIVKKCEFVAKISRIMPNYHDRSEFAHRLIRNYSLSSGNYNRPFRMQNIEAIRSLEKDSEPFSIIDLLMMHLYPQTLTDTDFRNDILIHFLFSDLDWLAPLIVLIDYFACF